MAAGCRPWMKQLIILLISAPSSLRFVKEVRVAQTVVFVAYRVAEAVRLLIAADSAVELRAEMPVHRRSLLFRFAERACYSFEAIWESTAAISHVFAFNARAPGIDLELDSWLGLPTFIQIFQNLLLD